MLCAEDEIEIVRIIKAACHHSLVYYLRLDGFEARSRPREKYDHSWLLLPTESVSVVL